MSKLGNITIAVVISSFLAFNFYLLFNKESKISKSLYVSEFERLTAGDFTKEMSKEGLISPQELSTVYVGNEDEVESWLISEGDDVKIGDELALLNTARSDEENELLNTKHQALLQQKSEMESLITNLNTSKSTTGTDSSSNVDRDENVTEVEGGAKIELEFKVDFTVDVTQEGSYAQAHAAAEQQLAEIAKELTVVEAQLAQESSNTAIISPVSGVVSNVIRHGSKLAVDIYSAEKIITTYAKDHEWQLIEEGDRVSIQGEGPVGIKEGNVISVSELPAADNKLIETYKKIDSEKSINPLAYYEVQMATPEELGATPYGHNVNTTIIIDEALGAVAVNEDWVSRSDKKSARGMIIDESGKAITVKLTTPFVEDTRIVVTEGLASGQVVFPMPKPTHDIHKGNPSVFLKMPTDMPTKKEWKSRTWKEYLKFMILK
ncbi:HlyD family secretion protein [Sporosarcina sp. Marseille-Q4063]|uniref:HlyD family secretion protein n=1 Tax=Sporosarcina sp. Marseille-Q4063 TaxID=2810514 RepID=UPI001BAFCCA9|nr:HlyD family secretion protein [Sporosarcina sp. Marseille-Q4063]QUW21191.1 HlyD family secretion protein [Sporosarcina sp. Marseille-Q4063]